MVTLRKTKEASLGHELSEGVLLVLRDLPEVCGIAAPGETLGGVTAEPAHYLVRFWPLLAQGTNGMWELGASLLFDIDTTARADKPTDRKHCTEVVRLRMGEGGAYGVRGLALHGYDLRQLASTTLNGSVCRGTAVFSNEPFSAILMLRMWLVQSAENHFRPAQLGGTSKAWWKKHGPAWQEEYPLARVIVPPSAYGAALAHSVVVPLQQEWVERMVAGKGGKPYPYTGK